MFSVIGSGHGAAEWGITPGEWIAFYEHLEQVASGHRTRVLNKDANEFDLFTSVLRTASCGSCKVGSVCMGGCPAEELVMGQASCATEPDIVPVCRGAAMPRYTAHVDLHLILRDSEGRVLLGRRQNTGWADGQLGLPSGHLEGGESATTGMAREAETVPYIAHTLRHIGGGEFYSERGWS